MTQYKRIDNSGNNQLEAWVNKKWKLLWKIVGVLIILMIILSVSTAWNPVHSYFCNHQPDNSYYALQNTLSVFNEYAPIINDSIIVVNDTNLSLNQGLDGDVTQFTKLIRMEWYNKSGLLIVWLYDSTAYGFQSYYFEDLDGKDQNLAQMSDFVKLFTTRNAMLFVNTKITELDSLIQERITYHSSNVLKSSCGKWHRGLWLFSSSMRSFLLAFTLFTLWLRQRYVSRMYKLHEEYTNQYGYKFSTVSFFVVFKEADPVLMVKNFQQQLEQEAYGFKKYYQELRRSVKKEKIFVTKAENLLSKLSEEFGEFIPGPIYRYLKDVFDRENQTLSQRNNALQQAEMEFINSSGGNRKTLQKSDEAKLISNRDQLHGQAKLHIDGISDQKDKDIAQQFWMLYQQVRTSEPDRLVKQIYFLYQVISSKVIEECVVSVAEDSFLTPKVIETSNSVMQLADVVDLFSVHKYLPKNIPHDYVVAIVIWGLLKPGQRGTTYVNEKYLRETNLRSDSQRKIGTEFNAPLYNKVLTWLLDEGVVQKPKRTKGNFVYSINPHATKATDKGAKIVNSVIAFRQILETTYSQN
ncbi:MAG: hypothetical protein ACNFW9_00670 [Candidatus Kerfeldbacteria bacterium]